MNKWKIVFWCCLTLLVSVTVFSLYPIIDQGVSLTYLKEGYTDTENDLDQLIVISKFTMYKNIGRLFFNPFNVHCILPISVHSILPKIVHAKLMITVVHPFVHSGHRRTF